MYARYCADGFVCHPSDLRMKSHCSPPAWYDTRSLYVDVLVRQCKPQGLAALLIIILFIFDMVRCYCGNVVSRCPRRYRSAIVDVANVSYRAGMPSLLYEAYVSAALRCAWLVLRYVRMSNNSSGNILLCYLASLSPAFLIGPFHEHHENTTSQRPNRRTERSSPTISLREDIL